ncbi:hypothetical protein VNO78_09437 [Psophocarpus tetragonolobus]|uniref:Uncharacterized protein n=1 Tax=Psophocarpus tetragonolobus TaxID=3891 RepID=A0AAN9XTI5_PSOTE
MSTSQDEPWILGPAMVVAFAASLTAMLASNSDTIKHSSYPRIATIVELIGPLREKCDLTGDERIFLTRALADGKAWRRYVRVELQNEKVDTFTNIFWTSIMKHLHERSLDRIQIIPPPAHIPRDMHGPPPRNYHLNPHLCT